jgi:hypothetical protein
VGEHPAEALVAELHLSVFGFEQDSRRKRIHQDEKPLVRALKETLDALPLSDFEQKPFTLFGESLGFLLKRSGHDLGAAHRIEAGEDPTPVARDRLCGNTELRRHLTIGKSLGGESKDLILSRKPPWLCGTDCHAPYVGGFADFLQWM